MGGSAWENEITLPDFLPRPRRDGLRGICWVSDSGTVLGPEASDSPREEGRRILGDPAGLGLPPDADTPDSPSSCSLGKDFMVMDTYLSQGSVSVASTNNNVQEAMLDLTGLHTHLSKSCFVSS